MKSYLIYYQSNYPPTFGWIVVALALENVFLFIHINRLKQLTPNLHNIPLLLYRASATTTQPLWVVEIFIFALLCLVKFS